MSTRRIGIEISTTAVRVAAIAVNGAPKLLGLGESRLPAGAVSDGGIVDRAAVRSAVDLCLARTGLRRAQLRKAEAWLGVAGLRAITRETEMPPVPDGELDAALQLQPLDILPFPADRAILSARRLGSDLPADGRMRVLLAAAHRDLIEPVVEVLEAAGIKLSGVDLASSALVRSLATAGSDAPEAEAIVDVGAELTTVVVHEHGEPCFVRTISGGGASATRAIARALDVPFAEAERLKLRLASGEPAGSTFTPEAADAARDGIAELLADIRNSVEYYSTLPGRPAVRRVLVTGGGSLGSGLLERLQAQMRYPVTAASPFAKLHAGVLRERVTELDSVAAVAVGMALPEPLGRKRIDLLPPEIAAKRRLRRVERAVPAAAAVVLLGLAGLGALRYVQLHSARQAEASVQESIALLNRQIPKFDKVEQVRRTLLADEVIAVPLVNREVNWPAVLTALAHGTPASVKTSGFSGSANTTSTTSTSVASSGSSSSASQIATVNVSLTATDYPAFQQWFASIPKSGSLAIMQYSGLTSGDRAVSFTAELGVTDHVRTDRLSKYQVVQP